MKKCDWEQKKGKKFFVLLKSYPDISEKMFTHLLSWKENMKTFDCFFSNIDLIFNHAMLI